MLSSTRFLRQIIEIEYDSKVSWYADLIHIEGQFSGLHSFYEKRKPDSLDVLQKELLTVYEN